MSLLGVDIGTTNCKAAVFSLKGDCLARASREYSLLYPKPGWIEFDSVGLVGAVFEIIRELSISARRVNDPIVAISICSFGEAMVPVSADRRILGNAIHHADERGEKELKWLLGSISAPELYAINPNVPSVGLSAIKLLWWRNNEPELFRATDKFLFFGDLIFYLMGCEAVTSFSQANRTLLFDFEREEWSTRVLALVGIDAERLPKPVKSGAIAGVIDKASALRFGFDREICCVVGAHDQACNALGAGIYSAGKAVSGIGTVECMTPVFAGIPELNATRNLGLHLEHHVVPGLHISFVYNQAGSLVKWFRDTFANHEQIAREVSIYDRLAAEMPSDPSRLMVLPHFQPTGAPGYIGNSSGVILGLRTSTRRGEILKAIMEGETFYFLESMKALEGIGITISSLVVTGGGSRSSRWLQIKADILGMPIERAADPESGILGAVVIAAVALGIYKSFETACGRFVRRGENFEPDDSRHARYLERFKIYQEIFPRLGELLGRV